MNPHNHQIKSVIWKQHEWFQHRVLSDRLEIEIYIHTHTHTHTLTLLYSLTPHPLSYPRCSSSVFVYTGFRNSATILNLLRNSSCSGHVILAQFLLDGPCFCFVKLKRFVGLAKKKFKNKFSAWMFTVYVEASIESCCFILNPNFV